MDDNILNGLSPACFFKWFGEICKISHGSGNERLLAEWIVSYAKARGYRYMTDAIGNIYMEIPAYPGYEDRESILFQSHLDMVCVKNDDIDFDFLKDPISLKIKDGRLYACGTTLGADNAVGVATMLALGDDSSIPHPKLEFLFTVQEEVGMNGIRAFDMSLIKSRRMINMDCGDSHVIAVSSLGNIAAEICKSFSTRPPEDATGLNIKLSGGLGGHPGLMAGKGRACAGNVMGRLLKSVEELITLTTLETSDVAILTSCSAVVCTATGNKEAVISKLKEAFCLIQAEYITTDPDLTLEIATVAPDRSLSSTDTKNVIKLLHLIKTAPIKTDGEHIITLSSLKKFFLENGSLRLAFQVRFTDKEDGNELFTSYANDAKALGFEVLLTECSVGWSEKKSSTFRNAFIDCHKNLFGYEPTFERVLGGIEIAPIVDALPDMDAVGIAPTARGAHTANEHIILSETEDYWNWLLAVLKM